MYVCPCCPHEDTDEESLNKHVNSHFLTEDTQHHADAAPAQNPNSPTPAITFTPAMTPSLTAPHLPVHHRDTDMDNTSHPASKRIRVQVCIRYFSCVRVLWGEYIRPRCCCKV